LKVNKLIQVIYEDPLQSRAADSGNEVSQIFASTLEFKIGEDRKDSPGCERLVHLFGAVNWPTGIQ